MQEDERRIFRALKDDFEFYASKCLTIRTKEGTVERFKLNKAQRHIHKLIEKQKRDTGKVRALILKGRQQGCSTLIGGRFYWLTTHRTGFKTFILAHMSDATDNLFKMVKRYHEHCPELLKPSTSTTNRKELVFDKLDSGYALGTAGSGDVGRSDTVQLLHGSEVGFWTNTKDLVTGVMQTIPDADDTEIILESTANGIGNMFHQYWQLAEAGQSDYQAIFIPWFWQEEYSKKMPDGVTLNSEELAYKHAWSLTDDQMYWRRQKIMDFQTDGSDGIWKFKQEYPATPAEAFQTSGEDSLISVEDVMNARTCVVPKQRSAYVVGVDPARFGKDRTAIIRRNGRRAFDLEYYSGKDTMEVAGICAMILRDEDVDKMFIDIGGLGAGVYDRLIELNYRGRVMAVNFGEKALKTERFVNKRAEMWGNMSKWLKEGECSLPDDNELHSDLVTPAYSYDSNSRLILESKKDIVKRGLRSPDGADALALTFAYPIAPPDMPRQTMQKDVDFDVF